MLVTKELIFVIDIDFDEFFLKIFVVDASKIEVCVPFRVSRLFDNWSFKKVFIVSVSSRLISRSFRCFELFLAILPHFSKLDKTVGIRRLPFLVHNWQITRPYNTYFNFTRHLYLIVIKLN